MNVLLCINCAIEPLRIVVVVVMVGKGGGGRGNEGMFAWSVQFKTQPFQLATQLLQKDLYMFICGSRH